MTKRCLPSSKTRPEDIERYLHGSPRKYADALALCDEVRTEMLARLKRGRKAAEALEELREKKRRWEEAAVVREGCCCDRDDCAMCNNGVYEWREYVAASNRILGGEKKEGE